MIPIQINIRNRIAPELVKTQDKNTTLKIKRSSTLSMMVSYLTIYYLFIQSKQPKRRVIKSLKNTVTLIEKELKVLMKI